MLVCIKHFAVVEEEWILYAHLTSSTRAAFMIKDLAKGFLLTQPKWLDYQLLTLHYQRSCKMVVINKNFLNCGWVSIAFRNLDKKSFYFRAITHMFNMTLSVFFNDFTALHHTQFRTKENTLHLNNYSIDMYAKSIF